MKVLTVSSSTFKVFVVLTSLAGVIVLSAMAYLDKDETVRIEDMGTAIGKDVTTTGTIVGTDRASDGSTMVMLCDGPHTVEVLLERGGSDLRIGSRVRLKGEVRPYGDSCLLEVASERSFEVLDRGDLHPFTGTWQENTIASFNGTVETASSTWFSLSELVIRTCPSEAGASWTRVSLDCLRVDPMPGTGDEVYITGLLKGDGRVLCYGDRSVCVTSKAVPLTADLMSLADTISRSPSEAPVGPFTLKAYLRSEPASSGYLSVGESPEGGLLNIRAHTLLPNQGLHRGDLVELRNCTLYWDMEQMRYSLEALEVLLIEPYGPWKLDLGGASDQLRYFVGTPVALQGTIHALDGATLLIDDGSAILLKNVTEDMIEGASGTLTGVVSFDGTNTRLCMDAGKGEWAV